MSETHEDDDGFDPSVLGTKEHWDEVYKREVRNFEENGDIGEIWFGEESVEKMIDWILENIPNKDIRTIDLGCGNGHMLLEMASLGYTRLLGVDYSQHSVDLAIKIADEQGRGQIEYKQLDILNPSADVGRFGLAIDKGTLDAISLAQDAGVAKSQYAASVSALLEDEGLLLLTSCNWTEDELVEILDQMETTATAEKVSVEPVELTSSDPMDVDTSAKVAPAAGADTHADLEDDVDAEATVEGEEDDDFDLDSAKDDKPNKAKDLTKDGGVIKKILQKGDGYDRPEAGDEVQVNYIGRLVQEGKAEGEGDEFDRNQDRQHPFTFILGKGQVIKGWDRAVKSMKKGELARVTIKPEYGYGASGAGAKIPPNATLEFDIELLGWRNVNALTADGLVTLKMLKESDSGWQTPKDGWEVIINYIAKADGVEYERVDGFSFTIGSSDESVPPFFSDAVKKFKKASGSKCGDVGLLTIPAKHFTRTHPKVPEGATVTYEIIVDQWIEVEELEGGGAFKRLLKEAESGWEKPKEGGSARVRLSGKTKVTHYAFLKGDEEIVVKVGDNSLPEAVEVALTTMRVGEKVAISANPDWGYGNKLTKELGLETLASEGFEFEVELLAIESKPKESYEMSKDEKIADSELLKEMGNLYFKDGKVRSAAKKYEKAVKNFQYENNLSSDEKKKVNAMKLPCHLNLAACFLKVQQYDKVIEECNKALAISSHSTKALYRRAQAHLQRIELDQAKNDLLKAIEYDSEQGGNDPGLKSLLKQVNAEIRKYEEKDRQLYKKMFR
ncbi:hypothetical protein HDU96_007226 [Phlyctochytrium bullatum]|nr:hypothetical protein HDU96_007226 [Phlyctochytrium bullatum]